ncbi:MAG: hypothetical protein ACI4TM_06175, partial [Candidatus Cryptobacteroides sp.]
MRNLLSKIGINIPLTQRDLRWILWQSYNANRSSDLINEAHRIALASRLGFTLQAQQEQGRAEDAIRRRDEDRQMNGSAADLYNRQATYWMNMLKESRDDMNQSVNLLVDAIEKATGKAAKSFEDIRLALTQQSSKELAEIKDWQRRFFNPMMQAIRTIMQETDFRESDISRYAMLKHGLERNEVFAKRDAIEKHRKDFNEAVAKVRNNDKLDDAGKKAEISKLEQAL